MIKDRYLPMASRLLRIIIPVVTLASTASADLIYDRGLPTANVNAPVVADRSNVAWGDNPANDVVFNTNWMFGDDFTLGPAGQAYTIDSLRVWIIGDAAHDSLDTIFSSLQLYGGIPGTSVSESPACGNIAGSGTCWTADGIGLVGGGSTSGADPNVGVAPALYSNGESYQGISSFRDIFEVTFNNLNWNVVGGTTYTFFVAGTPGTVGNGGVSPTLAASNAALSGNLQQGADGLMWEAGKNPSGANFTAMDQWNSQDGAWDKSSDINVLISGTQTPEPSTLILFAAGFAGVTLIRRRRLQ
jgi:hypothetical protein